MFGMYGWGKEGRWICAWLCVCVHVSCRVPNQTHYKIVFFRETIKSKLHGGFFEKIILLETGILFALSAIISRMHAMSLRHILVKIGAREGRKGSQQHAVDTHAFSLAQTVPLGKSSTQQKLNKSCIPRAPQHLYSVLQKFYSCCQASPAAVPFLLIPHPWTWKL